MIWKKLGKVKKVRCKFGLSGTMAFSTAQIGKWYTTDKENRLVGKRKAGVCDVIFWHERFSCNGHVVGCGSGGRTRV